MGRIFSKLTRLALKAWEGKILTGSRYRQLSARKATTGLDSAIIGIGVEPIKTALEFHRLRKERHSEAWDPSIVDIVYLLDLARVCQAQKILEFGSGITTAAMCSFIDKNNLQAEFISVDESSQWGDITNSLIHMICGLGVDKFFKQYICELEIVTYKGKQSFSYTNLPAYEPDMIYMDGPAFRDKVATCMDPLKLNMISKNTVVMFDGRIHNCDMMLSELRKQDNLWECYYYAYPSDAAVLINKAHNRYGSIISWLDNKVSK